MIKHKRVVVYIPEQDYLDLRVKLIRLGKNVSGWVRDVIRKFIEE